MRLTAVCSDRTCADTDGDGTPNAFACPAGNVGLVFPPENVTCAAVPCTAAECCTTCADDPGWRYSNVAITAEEVIPDWNEVSLGDSVDDSALEEVLRSVRWSTSPAPVVVSVAVEENVVYRLQLIFFERCCARGFDITVNGELILAEYSPYMDQGGTSVRDLALL